MKIVCISDTHNRAYNLAGKFRLPAADILIHAGDATLGGTVDEIMQFNEWLGDIKHNYNHVIFVAGNHDKRLSQPEYANLITNATYFHNSGIEIDGIKFYGSPMTPKIYRLGDFYVERGPAIKQYWNQIPVNTDVLITHCPPHGILDSTRPNSIWNEKVGCVDLLNKVLDFKPKAHIFGHIHESYGQVKHNETLFINAAVMDDTYTVRHKPIEIEI